MLCLDGSIAERVDQFRQVVLDVALVPIPPVSCSAVLVSDAARLVMLSVISSTVLRVCSGARWSAACTLASWPPPPSRSSPQQRRYPGGLRPRALYLTAARRVPGRCGARLNLRTAVPLGQPPRRSPGLPGQPAAALEPAPWHPASRQGRETIRCGSEDSWAGSAPGRPVRTRTANTSHLVNEGAAATVLRQG